MQGQAARVGPAYWAAHISQFCTARIWSEPQIKPRRTSRLALATENALITWRDLLRVGSSTLRPGSSESDAVVTAVGGTVLPALSFVPATSVWRSVPWSGIFCLGFLELGSQLV
jgi:hypothetical protein